MDLGQNTPRNPRVLPWACVAAAAAAFLEGSAWTTGGGSVCCCALAAPTGIWLAILLIDAVEWLASPQARRAMRGPFLRASLLLPTSVVAGGLLGVGWSELRDDGLPPGSWVERFDAAAWHGAEATKGDSSRRQQMLGDLVRVVLPALTREQAWALLGPPAKDGWLLGRQRRPIGIDQEWLTVNFDAHGRFVDFRVWND